MCDNAVDAFLPAFKFVPDWLVTKKNYWKTWWCCIFQQRYSLFSKESANIWFYSNEIGFISVNVNNINFYDANFDENDPETIIHVSLMVQRNRLKQHRRR